ncbi:MAG: hypothetical protein RI885_1626 [Actinomycetota bacterium]
MTSPTAQSTTPIDEHAPESAGPSTASTSATSIPTTPTASASSTPASSTPAQTVEPRGFSVASLVLGIASFAFGYTVVVPIVGLVLGILSLKREPASRAMSWWGIALNGLTLLGGALVVVFGLSALAVFGIADATSWVFPPVG